jgi:hypothetical protein
MKQIWIIIWLGFYTQGSFAQTLFQSVQEVGKKNITPSVSLKQKVAKISNRPIGTEKGEMNGIFDRDFYELGNGFISYGPEVNYMHYRLIFDKKENWLETQELFHGDVLPEEEYYQITAQMRTATMKKYLIPEAENYIKVSNPQSYWYEIYAFVLPKKSKTVILIFDKDLKLVRTRKK